MGESPRSGVEFRTDQGGLLESSSPGTEELSTRYPRRLSIVTPRMWDFDIWKVGIEPPTGLKVRLSSGQLPNMQDENEWQLDRISSIVSGCHRLGQASASTRSSAEVTVIRADQAEFLPACKPSRVILVPSHFSDVASRSPAISGRRLHDSDASGSLKSRKYSLRLAINSCRTADGPTIGRKIENQAGQLNSVTIFVSNIQERPVHFNRIPTENAYAGRTSKAPRCRCRILATCSEHRHI